LDWLFLTGALLFERTDTEEKRNRRAPSHAPVL
jgi:hypothetical protein